MSSKLFNFSDYDFSSIPDASEMRFGIVVSEWNNNITGKLLDGCTETLKKQGAKEDNIKVMTVPGSFELVFGCSQLAQSGLVDAVIAIGSVIKGDTPHFDFICQGATQGISQLNTTGKIPIIFGMLTTNTLQQAEERAGGILGNKGNEFAITAIKMVDYAWMLQK